MPVDVGANRIRPAQLRNPFFNLSSLIFHLN